MSQLLAVVIFLDSGSKGEDDTIEIIVVNQTDKLAQIAVWIEDNNGDALFNRVYGIEPEHTNKSAGIQTRPTTVTVFTSDGMSATWVYAPDNEVQCNRGNNRNIGIDIGIMLKQDHTFEPWYSC